MSIQRKLSLAIAIGFASIVAVFSLYVVKFAREQLTERFIQQHKSILSVVGTNLQELDKAVDVLSGAAVLYLQQHVQKHGVPSDQELARLAAKLGVSHFYVTDNKGRFIRSTETPIDVVEDKTIFDFCEAYRTLLDDPNRFERTPILPSYPYDRPFKFLMRSSFDRNFILEAGVHLKFISATLAEVVKNVPEVSRLGIYTPSGKALGQISAKGYEGTQDLVLAQNDDKKTVQAVDGGFVFYQKVPSATENCCECKVKNIQHGKTGEYFYWVVAFVSTDTLEKDIASAQREIVFIAVIAILLFAVAGWYLGHRLSARFLSLHSQIESIVQSKSFLQRLRFTGNDEVARTAADINNLLDVVEVSNREAALHAEAKKVAHFARTIAHDLRSPLAALKAVIEDNTLDFDLRSQFIRESFVRISDLATNLAKGRIEYKSDSRITCTVEEAIVRSLEAKKLEVAKVGAKLTLSCNSSLLENTIPGNQTMWFRVLSNLINNSVEACKNPSEAAVHVDVLKSEVALQVVISDNGVGMSPEVLRLVSGGGYSFGKESAKDSGAGLGVSSVREILHGWGGSVHYESQLGQGTKVSLRVPLFVSHETT